ncbi:Inositol monophosphatase 3 [Micractinium conductrix]|uniref:Inositol-1-monophosphatase n=1 Tax=Micractinium conductrix TaxID=554055 RepID=A0A2P6V4R2_9CHLO|nr:Inositol monophosphatase 3 [Micractinium conductrix]|eukprot:PSC69083.1 Inositol monophosphatase 3 [Micractinium conductrix]
MAAEGAASAGAAQAAPPTGPLQAAPELAPYLQVALDAAREAGAVIAAAWNAPKQVDTKAGDADLVTETDKKCEALILERISAAFPAHKFIGEEGSAVQGFTDELTHEPTWMVDPVDGTTNFVHRYPFSCVSIGLTINKQPVVGVVFNPILNELYHATRGGGAFLNGAPITASDTTELRRAVVGTEMGTRRDDGFMDACFDRIRTLGQAARSLRCSGSCALNLCSVAQGRLDAFFELGLGGCWDLCAGVLVLEEAGGRVIDPTGGPFNIMSRRVLGTNAHLAEQVATILAGCKYDPEEPPALPPLQ